MPDQRLPSLHLSLPLVAQGSGTSGSPGAAMPAGCGDATSLIQAGSSRIVRKIHPSPKSPYIVPCFTINPFGL